MICSPQGVCADQSKVCGYHRFQQAEFSQSVLTELMKLFDTRSELLHQKVALHAYTALLSRLQVESYLYHLLKGRRGEAKAPGSTYTVFTRSCAVVIRLFWEPNAASFSPAPEGGRQRPLQLHTSSP